MGRWAAEELEHVVDDVNFTHFVTAWAPVAVRTMVITPTSNTSNKCFSIMKKSPEKIRVVGGSKL